MARKQFISVILTSSLAKCEVCQNILKCGESAFISRDLVVCDELCAADWRQENERGKDEKFLDTLQFQTI